MADASTTMGRIGQPRPPMLALLLPIGVAVVWFALAGLGAQGAQVQVPVVAVGLVACWFGIDAALGVVFGRRVETGVWLSGAWVVTVVLAAVFADLLPLAEAEDVSKTLTTPTRMRPDLFSAHPLGTDVQGLDILGGVIYGARVSLQVGVLAVAIGTVVGGLIGVASGYFRGRLDAAIGLATDSMLAFPPLILLLAVVSAVDPGVAVIAASLAVLGIPTYVRLARANTMAFAQREFVMAARAIGARPSRIIMRELVPNVVRPLLSYSFIIIAVLIVAEASLSFLGVGIQRPTPTWGNMISAGQGEIQTTPHLVFVPGAVMFLTVFALNRLGDKARQVFDPKESAL